METTADFNMSKRQFLLGAGASIGTIALGGCFSTGIDRSIETASVRIGPTPQFSLAQAQGLVNAYRSQHGLKPLQIQPQLQQAAVHQASLMAHHGQMKHSFGGKTKFRNRVRAVGFQGKAAENIAAGQPTLEEVVAAWMKSPGHRKNMLNRSYHSFGLAVQTNPNAQWGHYWAMVLGA